MHRGKCLYCCALHKNYYNYFAELDSENGIGYNIATMKLEVQYMLAMMCEWGDKNRAAAE